MRVTNHVYVLSGGHYSAGGQSNLLGEVYGVDAPGGLILVDSGFSKDAYNLIAKNLSYYGLAEHPSCVVLTHAHFDHCGNARAYQEAGAAVVAGAEDAYQCVNGGSAGLENRTPFDDAHIYPAFEPDILIAEDCVKELCGMEVRFFKIPGHTPGSIAALLKIDGKTLLFTGDALCPGGGHLIESVSLGWQGDIKFSRESIVNSMMHLFADAPETDIILPGHGMISMQNGAAVIRLAAQTAFSTMR